MDIALYISDDGCRKERSPVLLVRECALLTLPPHPRGMAWRVVATFKGEAEENFVITKREIEALERYEFCMFNATLEQVVRRRQGPIRSGRFGWRD